MTGRWLGAAEGGVCVVCFYFFYKRTLGPSSFFLLFIIITTTQLIYSFSSPSTHNFDIIIIVPITRSTMISFNFVAHIFLLFMPSCDGHEAGLQRLCQYCTRIFINEPNDDSPYCPRCRNRPKHVFGVPPKEDIWHNTMYIYISLFFAYNVFPLGIIIQVATLSASP